MPINLMVFLVIHGVENADGRWRSHYLSVFYNCGIRNGLLILYKTRAGDALERNGNFTSVLDSCTRGPKS